MVKILPFIFISSNLIYHVIILDFEFQVLKSIVLRNQSAMLLICFLIGIMMMMSEPKPDSWNRLWFGLNFFE
jgi:hypothetical protein